MPDSLPLSLSRFHEVREVQCLSLFGRPYSATDRRASDYLYETSARALQDIREGREDVTFRVCSMPTGYGKSTAAIALMVAMVEADPHFSAVYVCKERRFAEQVGDDLDRLALQVIGRPIATVYTSAHADARDRVACRAHYEARYGGFVPARPMVRKDALQASRIIVVTHKTWVGEIERDADQGVRFYEGSRRLSFIDEQPDLVSVVELRPGEVQAFHDRVSAVEGAFAARLAEVVGAMNAMMATKGPDFAVPAITAPGDEALFGSMLKEPEKSLQPFVTPGRLPADQMAERNSMERVCRFLVAASRMAAFYCRRDKTFWAYETAIRPGAGTVLLDATADMGPIVAFLPGVPRPTSPPPAVDYANLEVAHVVLPREFGRPSELLKKASTAQPYAAWCEKVVNRIAPEGSRVLVVAHKAAFDHLYLPSAPDVREPKMVSGRLWNTLHWGTGIGSNEFKDHAYVFLFGEYFVPQAATVSEVHGHAGRTITASDLFLSRPVRTKDGDRLPRGDYGTATENHLLRWSVQLAARGSVRNIDGEGRCGRMTLVTTMDYGRLLRWFPRLFPGALPPQSLSVPIGDDDTAPSTVLPAGRDGLVRLLAESNETLLTGPEMGRLTAIPTTRLSRELKADRVLRVLDMRGWRVATNRQLGRPGKGLNLVREPVARAA